MCVVLLAPVTSQIGTRKVKGSEMREVPLLEHALNIDRLQRLMCYINHTTLEDPLLPFLRSIGSACHNIADDLLGAWLGVTWIHLQSLRWFSRLLGVNELRDLELFILLCNQLDNGSGSFITVHSDHLQVHDDELVDHVWAQALFLQSFTD